jgi:hypothetical protein
VVNDNEQHDEMTTEKSEWGTGDDQQANETHTYHVVTEVYNRRILTIMLHYERYEMKGSP